MLRRPASLLLLAVLACLTASSLDTVAQEGSATQAEGTLRGTIVDPALAPIQAFVIVHSDRVNENSLQVRVKLDGTFEQKLMPGLYDIFVAYPAFLPIAKIIEIKKDKTTHLKLTMKLDEKHLESVLVE